MAAIDQHRELHRGGTSAAPQDVHRALYRPSAVEDVVDQHDHAPFGAELLDSAVDRANRIAGTVHIDERGGNLHAAPRLDQMTDAHAEQRAAADDTDNRHRGNVAEVVHDLIGERLNCLLDFVGVHDLALRSALIRLVTGLFGLLDAIEDRERAFRDPRADVVGETFVIAIVAMRAGVTDELDRQLALAEIASQEQRGGGASAREAE